MKKCYNKKYGCYDSAALNKCSIWADVKNCDICKPRKKKKKKKMCKWNLSNLDNDDIVLYTVSCCYYTGVRPFGTPHRKHKYCPYCGKKIKYARVK